MSQDQTYLWVPINGPGSILSLFASVIFKMLRSIQSSSTLIKSHTAKKVPYLRVDGLNISTQRYHLWLRRCVQGSDWPVATTSLTPSTQYYLRMEYVSDYLPSIISHQSSIQKTTGMIMMVMLETCFNHEFTTTLGRILGCFRPASKVHYRELSSDPATLGT